MTAVSLVGVELTNLRGFYLASLELIRPCTVLVGPNNSGKTSVLRLLNWVINELDDELLEQNRSLTAEEQDLLLPARDARHRARRLRLNLRVADARSWAKFECDQSGLAALRVNVRLTPETAVYLALGEPSRGEGVETGENAFELLMRLRRSIRFVHIPSFRDAKSEKFNTTLRAAISARIEERALHAAQAGAPREHREVAEKLDELRNILLRLARPLWDDVSSRLPPGMARDAVVAFDCDQATFLQFLESCLKLRISTGEHDALTVPLEELGSGLQSLLDLAIQDSKLPSSLDEQIIAVEEPEAFLHPAAQRTVAGRLLRDDRQGRRVVVTTHSPIVVEEARFGDVVLCRQHRLYAPNRIPDETRESINTALLSGYGAEMVFGTAILLVEGEGDRQFFERLRRRIAKQDSSGVLDSCFVVPVGGKSQFAMWLRLLSSYGDAGNRPIKWLVAPDADAATEIQRAFRDAGLTLNQEMQAALGAVSAAHNAGDIEDWRRTVRRVNRLSRLMEGSIHMLELDLEEAAIGEAGDDLIDGIATQVRWTDHPSRDETLRRLGAKGFGGADGKKHVYVRGFIGESLSPDEITANALVCLRRWFTLAAGAPETNRLLRAWKA